MQNPIAGSAASVAAPLAGAAAPTTSTTTLLSGVANLLGTTTDDLIDRLRAGASLSDLASAGGASRDALLATITDGLEANRTTLRQAADPNADAALIADRKGLGTQSRRHHHHGAGIQAGSESLRQRVADLSTALGVSDDELVRSLQNGLASSGSGAAAGYGVSAALLQGLRVDRLA